MRKRTADRGAVLILVIAAVAVLSIVAVELASRASADSLRADRAARDAAFRRLFDSGGAVARRMIAPLLPDEPVAWNAPWTKPLRFELGVGESASVTVADESGKINLARIWTHAGEAPVIRLRAARLLDTLAKQDRKQASFREKVMERLSKTEALLTLDGLRETGLELDEVFGTLARYFTCFGDGRINLNTAPGAVLAALDPELDAAMVESIVRWRGTRDGEKPAVKVFQDPRDLELIEGIVTRSLQPDGTFRISRNLYEKLKDSLGVNSKAFSARLSAQAAGRSREAWVFLHPGGARLALEELQP